ncbi:hypothetical protein [Pseudomonas sp. AL03]|uniref:hypothetical protein n=1 Tax=Pseudomonas sp. AL03 TaxID=3042230 RepID=UPI00249A9F67|nr:hypothetical protein [Pseudomonas sp. AL03]MDI3274850.1 hypothetical protein [Pseudomonas sp. AL03]
MHPKNSTTPETAQALLTTLVGFFDTPIDNRGIQLLNVAPGANAEDALQTAKVLSSGLGQICRHMHDSLNMGELAYCDGMATLGFLAETVGALVLSVQKGAATSGEAAQ